MMSIISQYFKLWIANLFTASILGILNSKDRF